MRYFIGFLVTIGLIILLIVLLVTGGHKAPPVAKTSRPLASYANTDATVRFVVDGPVSAPESHKAVRITVNRNQISYERLKGYDGEAVLTKTFANTESSYQAFLRSLELAGFTQGNGDKDLKDERGYCPLGNRYIFEMKQGSKSLQRFWSTSCRGTRTFEGKTPTVISLFKRQVPDTAVSGYFVFN